LGEALGVEVSPQELPRFGACSFRALLEVGLGNDLARRRMAAYLVRAR
jgi:hypothetical protein